MEIWLPTREEAPAYRCNVPVNDAGEACGRSFYKGQERAYRTHVQRCTAEHAALIHELHIFQRAPEFFDGDKELFGYAKEHATEILEGRKKL